MLHCYIMSYAMVHRNATLPFTSYLSSPPLDARALPPAHGSTLVWSLQQPREAFGIGLSWAGMNFRLQHLWYPLIIQMSQNHKDLHFKSNSPPSEIAGQMTGWKLQARNCNTYFCGADEADPAEAEEVKLKFASATVKTLQPLFPSNQTFPNQSAYGKAKSENCCTDENTNSGRHCHVCGSWDYQRSVCQTCHQRILIP